MSIFNEEPFLIAEIGVNYYDIAKKENISNMDAAKLMVKEAKDAGCNAVKFQSYKANTIASKNSPAYWDTNEEPTTSQYELFKKFDSFGEAEYREIADYCKEIGIMFLSTPFKKLESCSYQHLLILIQLIIWMNSWMSIRYPHQTLQTFHSLGK